MNKVKHKCNFLQDRGLNTYSRIEIIGLLQVMIWVNWQSSSLGKETVNYITCLHYRQLYQCYLVPHLHEHQDTLLENEATKDCLVKMQLLLAHEHTDTHTLLQQQ